MTLRIGFIGGYGHHYIRQVMSEEHVEVAVASDGHDANAAREVAARLNEAAPAADLRWFEEAEDLIDTFHPDVLSVGAVYGYNGVLNAMAMARNIPTVTDKPAAATWEQLRRLQELAAENPARILLTEFDFRCRPDFRAAQAAITRGDIGEVVLATAQKSYRYGARPAWYADRAAYGGTLLWVASHGIDAIEWVTGKKLTRRVGRGGNVSQPRMGSMEDHVALLAELEGGGTGIVHADFLRPSASAGHGDDRIRVAGTRGIVEVRDGRTELIRDDGLVADITATAGDLPTAGRALFDAARGKSSDYFSTALTLSTAERLLRARDACDQQIWK